MTQRLGALDTLPRSTKRHKRTTGKVKKWNGSSEDGIDG